MKIFKGKPKILVVGGAGYVGGALTDLLMARGYEIEVYDNLTYETRYTKNVPFIYADVRDQETLSSVINDYDVVFWLAALVGEGACVVNPIVTQEVNCDSVAWLAENFKGHIVFPSTCSVYGAQDDHLDESSPTNPLSIYASSKLAAENILTQKRPDALVFRLGTLYGLSDGHSRPRFDLVVNSFSKSAAMGATLMVHGGQQWRPLLHVKDVAEAMVYGIEHNITGLYNLMEKNYRVCDITEEVKRLIPQVEFHDKKIEDLRNYKVNGDKYKRLGWRPKYNLQFGILEIRELIKSGRVKNPNDAIHSNAEHIKNQF